MNGTISGDSEVSIGWGNKIPFTVLKWNSDTVLFGSDRWPDILCLLKKKYSYYMYISKINNCTTAKYTSMWSFVTARISYQQSKSLHLEIDLRWLTTVFLRLTSAHYDSPPHVSICRVCKNDASNLKKYQKNTPALERRQISLVYVVIVSKFAQACIQA